MKRVLLTSLTTFICLSVYAQLSFTNGSTLFSDPTIRSGVAMGVVDMNGDGLDDIVRLHNASDLSIEYQQAGGGQFTNYVHGNAGPGREWGMAIADVDEDGYNDVMVGGVSNRLKVFLMDANGVDSVYWMPLPNIFLQAANFVDIDNDGLVDLFACDDNAVSSAYRNLGNNDWLYDLTLIDASSPDPNDDNSGNYGSVWTDYDSDGDIDLYLSKCRGGVSDPFDGRRTNLLFENDGSNNFTEKALTVGLRPYAQSWAADFADIDNDGDLDCFVVNHDSISKLYLNENNLFTDITPSSGMFATLDDWSIGIQCVFDDFDNDTWVDLIVTGVEGHYLYKNNGDNTFSVTSAFPAGTPGMHSLSVGDLNNDGFLDILAGYAQGFNTPSSNPDRLFINDGNDNNWIKVNLSGTTSNLNGIGARLELYGNWGKQIREVRGGEGYGIVTSIETHFGIAADSTIDSLVVKWPSGTRDVICNPNINETINVSEGCWPTCAGMTSVVEETICEGESYFFAGMELTEEGTYEDEVVTPEGCDGSVYLELYVVGISTAVTQDGYTLTAPSGLNYVWIDCGNGNLPVGGENGQSFTATEDGMYAVIVSDENCSDTSDCFNIVGTAVLDEVFPFTIDVFPNPSNGSLNVKFGQVIDRAELRIQSIHGAEIYREYIESTGLHQLDISHLPAGNYILEIVHDGRRGVMPLIRQ